MPHRNILNSVKEILPRKFKKPFGSLEVYPDDVSFSTQNIGERVYILMRSHVAINIGWVLRGIILLVLPLMLAFAIDLINLLLSDQGIRITFTGVLPLAGWIIIALVYYSLVVSYFVGNFLDWYFDVYIVTNERMLHIDYQLFRGKSIAEAPLANIEDISQQVLGFFPSIFNYGDLLVQTAAQKNKFNFRNVPDPSWFRNVLADLSKLLKEQNNG